MRNALSVDLNTHSLTDTPHKVEEYSGQKVFYSQNWIIDFTSSNNSYKSPFFSEKGNQTFTIFFLLSFNDNDKVTLSGYLVEQTSYQIVKVFFQIGDPKNKSTSKNDLWSFTLNKSSNMTEIHTLKKSDLTSDGGWLDENKKLNIYFEISYYNNPTLVQQNHIQQPKLPQDEIVKKLQQTPGRIGLKNMNSMCYINSILQVLFHIPKFRQILFSVDTSKSESKSVLIQTQFLFYMMENSNNPCSANDLAHAIPFCSNQGNTGKQQDAHEFAMSYLDNLEKNLQGTDKENAIKDLFFGSYKSIIKCKNVDFEKSNPDTFMSVNIPVHRPENEKATQELNESFKQYISKTELEYKTDQYGLQPAERWTQFTKLPPVLQICFLRSTFDIRSSQLEKQEFPVSFTKTLYLYYLTNNMDDEYRLYAVLSHNGGGNCGHYCVFIRDIPGKKWFKYNDSTVSEVTIEDAIDGNFGTNMQKNKEIAYILYYVRKSDQEHLFECTKNSEMSPQMKNFMEKLRLKKLQEEYEKNNVSFQFILEEKLNSKSSIDDFDATLSDKILKIQNSESRFTLYLKVAELFQRNVRDIRLWTYENKTGSYELIIPTKKSYLSNLPTNQIFIQNKERTEKLLPSQIANENDPGNEKIMIFLKYFDTRLSLPIRYIGSLLIDKNGSLDVRQICNKLGFPEWTKYYFFKEKSPISVQPFQTGSPINQGSVIIAQVNKEATALTKPTIDKSISSDTIQQEPTEGLEDQITSETTTNSLPDLQNNETFKTATFKSIDNQHSDFKASLAPESSTLPHFSAQDIIKYLKTDLLDYYLASRFDTVTFYLYDYEHQKKPLYTLNFPCCLKFSDMINIVRKRENFPPSDGYVLLFSRDTLYDKATYHFLNDSRFSSQIQTKKFPQNKIYFLLARGIPNMIGKLVYNLEFAPDGYNVSFRKTIIETKTITPIEILKKSEVNFIDLSSIRCFSVNNSTIEKKIILDQPIESNLYPIRFAKFIEPNVDEVSVRVYQAKIDKQLALTFVNEPFYMNLKDGISVAEFKKKIRDLKIEFNDVDEFMNAKVEVTKIEDHRSSGCFLEKPDDRLVGLVNDCVVYIIYK